MNGATTVEPGKTPDGMRFGLVAYLDLLGQRQLFSSTDAGALREVLDFAGNYKKSAGEAPGMPLVHAEIPRSFVAFQDSLVRCTEIGWNNAPESIPIKLRAALLGRWIQTIVDEIASLRDIQLNFVCKRGILLRGAVALGVYDVTHGRVHGPAFMNALNGEQEWAKFPRILIDNKIVEFSQSANPHHDWIQANTCSDDDGYWFVDYLHGAACEAPWDAAYFIEYAVDHKYLIESVLRGDRALPAEKSAWLRGYHDRSIRRVAGYLSRRGHMDPDDLLVVERVR